MRRGIRFRGFRVGLLAAGCLLGCAAGAFAQSTGPAGTKADAPGAAAPSLADNHKRSRKEGEHRFWDRENAWLFAGVGAARTLDYFSTLNMRRRGRQEIFLTNDVVDNHAAFAAIEASATGVSIGAAYLFHRYGHHKLERWTSIVHIGLATTGSVRNYCLKTAHFTTTPGSP
ncbi:MAG: hypothetical protein WBA09_04075 [Candidatus Acidiferrum sp.]